MKNLCLLFAIGLFGLPANAQQAVQMECHDLAASNNVLGPDETLVNGMACHVVKQQKPQATVQTAGVVPAKEVKPIAATPAGAVSSTPETTNAVATPVSAKIVPGARVYISPMEGFENYLAAALSKKKVPLVAVGDPAAADYVISGTSQDKKAGWAKIVFMGNIHSDNSASVTMTDKKTGAIVFAYAVDKKSTLHGQQTTAEACAKHLKNQIEDENKK